MFLLIDCSDGTRVALQGKIPTFAEMTINQSSALPIMVEELLTKNSVKFSDINAVGVVVGPGSFTGIRIGIAYAKGIGLALGIPVIPINRLEVALRDSPDSIIAIDDKKGGWFAQSRTMPASAIQSVDGNVIYNPELDIDTAFEIMEEKINAANPVIPLYLKPHYAEKK